MIKSSRTTTKVSAVFLAAVLLAGTIALSAPSFMTGINAQAQPYYGGGMDNSYDKPYGKDNRDKSKDSVNIKKIKCNNINVNVNGVALNLTNANATSFPLFSGLLADDADRSEDNYGAASYGSGGSYGGHSDKDKDGFTFVCINNNNNEVGGGNVTAPEPEPVEEGCEECFDNLTVDLKVILNEALAEGFEIGPLNVTAGSTIAELCEELDSVAPLEIPIIDVIEFIFEADIRNDEDILSFLELLICLQALELIDVDIFTLRALLVQQGLITP